MIYEERKIQRFLDRAAPIVLESPVLNTQRWGVLVALAEEMDVSDEQFRQTIDDLRLVRGASCPLPADLNGDDRVDFGDILMLLAAWGPCAPPPAPCPADLDGDGTVAFADLIALLAQWG